MGDRKEAYVFRVNIRDLICYVPYIRTNTWNILLTWWCHFSNPISSVSFYIIWLLLLLLLVVMLLLNIQHNSLFFCLFFYFYRTFFHFFLFYFIHVHSLPPPSHPPHLHFGIVYNLKFEYTSIYRVTVIIRPKQPFRLIDFRLMRIND